MARRADGSEEEEHTMLPSADCAPGGVSQHVSRSETSTRNSRYVVDGDAVSVDTCDNFRTLSPFLTAESKDRSGVGGANS
jgi:hypothetical protein